MSEHRSLAEELDRLHARDSRSFVLTGLTLGGRAPGHSWLRRVAGHWLRQHPGVSIEVANKSATGREAQRIVDEHLVGDTPSKDSLLLQRTRQL